MSWGEAVSLTRMLCQDPTSWVAAAIAGWDHPVSREALMLMDVYDLTVAINTDHKKSRPKPYPRPWPDVSRKIAKSALTQEETLAALRFAGHTNLPG